VRTGVVEILALEQHLGAAAVLAETLGLGERARASGVVDLQVAQLLAERRIVLGLLELGVQLLQRWDQRLGDEPAPEGIEVTAHVGEIRELHRYS